MVHLGARHDGGRGGDLNSHEPLAARLVGALERAPHELALVLVDVGAERASRPELGDSAAAGAAGGTRRLDGRGGRRRRRAAGAAVGIGEDGVGVVDEAEGDVGARVRVVSCLRRRARRR